MYYTKKDLVTVIFNRKKWKILSYITLLAMSTWMLYICLDIGQKILILDDCVNYGIDYLWGL